MRNACYRDTVTHIRPLIEQTDYAKTSNLTKHGGNAIINAERNISLSVTRNRVFFWGFYHHLVAHPIIID